MGSTYERSLVKGIVWEFFSFIITTIAIYIFYGNFLTSIKFSVILSIIKAFIFFFHERAWKKVKWGKIEETKKKKK
jgi:adenylylsulfate kinase